jgi:hypothetical protein
MSKNLQHHHQELSEKEVLRFDIWNLMLGGLTCQAEPCWPSQALKFLESVFRGKNRF